MSAGLVPVFVYTGPGGNGVPQNVVRVRVDPSVTSIPAQAFNQRTKLAEVELCEGLVEIGEDSFSSCCHSITNISIPSTLRRICDAASHTLFELRYISMMALKALEKDHSLTASSQTLESHRSSP